MKPLENAMTREPGRYRALTREAKLDYWEKRLPWCERYRTRLVKRLNAAKGDSKADDTAIESELNGAIFLAEECERAIKNLKGGTE